MIWVFADAVQGQSSGPIAVPRVRTVEDYHVNQQAAAHHGPFIEGPVAAAPYLRHKHVLPGMYEEHQPTEYDVDDDDIAWLGKMNAKVRELWCSGHSHCYVPLLLVYLQRCSTQTRGLIRSLTACLRFVLAEWSGLVCCSCGVVSPSVSKDQWRWRTQCESVVAVLNQR